MDDYNRYVTAVNKIFDYLEKLKVGWNNIDNKNYIESIDEFKSVVTSKAELIKQPPTVKVDMSDITDPSTTEESTSTTQLEENLDSPTTQPVESLAPETQPQSLEQPTSDMASLPTEAMPQQMETTPETAPVQQAPQQEVVSIPEVPTIPAAPGGLEVLGE